MLTDQTSQPISFNSFRFLGYDPRDFMNAHSIQGHEREQRFDVSTHRFDQSLIQSVISLLTRVKSTIIAYWKYFV